MAIVDPIVLEKSLKTTFAVAYDAAEAWYPDLCVEVPSNATDEKYAWLGQAPVMSEWVDERQLHGLLDHSFTIKNKHYEATLELDLDDYEDDQTGQIDLRVRDQGNRARRHPDQLVTDLLNDGESTTCYDGQFFFDTDHLEGSSGSQDNDLSQNVTDTAAVTQAEAETLIFKAQEAMLGFKDDRNQPFIEDASFDASNFVVMSSHTHRKGFMQALTANLVGGGDTNIARNLGRHLVNTRLSGNTKVYCFYIGGVVRPMVFQNRKGMRTGMLGATSDMGFMKNIGVFGVDARYNVGYGMWQFAILTTLT